MAELRKVNRDAGRRVIGWLESAMVTVYRLLLVVGFH
jgi:hypothetical protein